MVGRESFKDTVFWINEVQYRSPGASIFLVGAKKDASHVIPLSTQLQQASSFGVTHYACSAHEGDNIHEMFADALKKYLKRQRNKKR